MDGLGKKTDVREGAMEDEIKGKDSYCKYARERNKKHAREREGSEMESLHPLGYLLMF